jgi:hypothetical protein
MFSRSKTPPHAYDLKARSYDYEDEAEEGWDDDQEDAATSHRARRLLTGWSAFWARLGERLEVFSHRLRGHFWLRRLAISGLAVAVLFSLGFGLLWWRLGEGPVGLDMATPWLAAAIEDNLGSDHTVEVGGTQIERVGRIRMALRVRDIVVRDRDHAIVASAPKAEVRISGTSLLMGRLRAESLNLVDAELSVRIQRDGRISIMAGSNARPIVTEKPVDVIAKSTPATPRQSIPEPGAASKSSDADALTQAIAWIDRLSASGLDGYDLNEIGLKNGHLVVDDQQSNNRWTFENITLSLRRPSAGGVALKVGEDGPSQPWSLRVAVGAPSNGVRSVDIAADKISTTNILLALGMSDASYTADFPLTAQLRGEIGRDGLPTYFTGKISADAGSIVDRKVPEYPMAIDRIDINVDWDSTRRVLVAPFQVQSGGNRITLLAHLEPPNDTVSNWQLGLSGGTILLPGVKDEAPLIFNRVAVRIRFDTDHQRLVLTQGDISNGEIGVSATATYDYSQAEPRLTAGLAGTPMSASALKRMWPVLINPEVREWIIERVERGSLQRAEIAVNAPMNTLARGGPPIPDDGLAISFLASNVTLHPVDQLPPVHDADMRVRVTGRTATVNIAQAGLDTAAGRKLNISDFVFEIPDIAPKPMPTKVRFRLDGPVPAVAEILASDRLSSFAGTLVDPNTSKGTVTAQVSLAMPLQQELSNINYAISADMTNFSADKLVMNQKLEANLLKIVANNQGYQIKGDVKINGQPASLDYRKPQGDGDADIRLQATLDDASRAKLGIDLGSQVTGAIPLKLSGKVGAQDRDSRFGIEADLSSARIDNVLPGWVKLPGKSGKATFTVVKKDQSTRFEDLSIEGGGALIKGSLEVDQNGELLNAAFPTYQPSDGDKASLKAERTPDGVLKVTLRGDLMDGRGFIKSSLGGGGSESKSKQKPIDFDLDLKLGAVAGYYGEAIRAVDVKLSRRGGTVKGFTLSGKIGRDTLVKGDMRGRSAGRNVLYIETNDAGALFRFTDTYAKMAGGQMWVAMDPPTADEAPQEGLINVRDFSIKGEKALQQVASNGPPGSQSGISFSRARAEFTRRSGQLGIRDGIVSGPTMGATVEGKIDYAANQVRMSGTFLPAYGLNNMFGQIPIVGLFLGGGSNEGLIGITYEVVGTPGAPTLRVNPISAIAPGVFRKVFEFGTGRQGAPQEFPPPP